MSSTARAIMAGTIRSAASQIGYIEGTPPYTGSNHTKYWADLYPAANGRGADWAWCATFGTWNFLKGGGVDFRPLFWPYYCGYWVSDAAKYGAWNTKGNGYTPRAGDVVIYGNDDHWGHVEKWLGGIVPLQTIEGNTSGNTLGSQANGGMVARKRRNTAWVKGYINVEKYLDALAAAGKITLHAPPSAPSRGTTRPPVRGVLVVDGDLGPNTIRAWQTYYKRRGAPGIVVDGVIDRSGSALIKAVQRDLNTEKSRGRDGRALTIDGDLGPNTIWALQTYYRRTDSSITVDGVIDASNSATVKHLQRDLNRALS